MSIFCHLPPPVRRAVHGRVVAALRPGGALILEAYTPDQIGRGTGGPPVAEMMYTLDLLRQELAGLRFVHAVETQRPDPPRDGSTTGTAPWSRWWR